MMKYLGLCFLLMVGISVRAQMLCNPAVSGQHYFSNSSFQQTEIQAWALFDQTHFAGVGKTNRQEAYFFMQPSGKTFQEAGRDFNAILPFYTEHFSGSTYGSYLIAGANRGSGAKNKGCIFVVDDLPGAKIQSFPTPDAVEEVLSIRAIPYIDNAAYLAIGRTGGRLFIGQFSLNTPSELEFTVPWSNAYFDLSPQIKQVEGLYHAVDKLWWLTGFTSNGTVVYLLRDNNGKLEEVDHWANTDRFLSLNASTVDGKSGDLILAGTSSKVRFGNNWVARLPLREGRIAATQMNEYNFGGEGRDYPIALQYLSDNKYALLFKTDAQKSFQLKTGVAFAGQDLKFDAKKCWATELDAETSDLAGLIQIPGQEQNLFIGVSTSEARPRSYNLAIPGLKFEQPEIPLISLSPPPVPQWSAQVSLLGATTMGSGTKIEPPAAPCNFKLRSVRKYEEGQIVIEFPSALPAQHQIKIWQNSYTSAPDTWTIKEATRSIALAQKPNVNRIFLMDVQNPTEVCYEVSLAALPAYSSNTLAPANSRGQVAGVYPQVRTRQGEYTCKDTLQLRPPGLDTSIIYDLGAQFGTAADYNTRYRVVWMRDGRFFRADTLQKKCTSTPLASKPRLFVICIGMQYQDKKWQQVFSENNATQLSEVFRMYGQTLQSDPHSSPYESIHIELITGAATRGKELLILQFKRLKELWKPSNPSKKPLMRSDQDRLVVFLSGHGSMDEKSSDPRRRYVICTDYYDVDYPETYYYGTDFYQRMLNDFSCAKTAFIIETCASGQLLKDIVGMGAQENKSTQFAAEMVQQFAMATESPDSNPTAKLDQRDVFLLTSTAQDSASFADPELKRGYFSWYLIESMLQCQEPGFNTVDMAYLLKKIGEKVEKNNRQSEKHKLPSPIGIVGSSFPLLQLNTPAQIKKLHEEARKKKLCE
ncbi:MAG: caspase family protein [Haliscomenobacter sp.]|uniref:caspase family protein n=1 Tax=Haliscomenobacter sp. TaxID=2717303 RepID=UPI0029B8E180|nr:caspase family protein [Haliscomenobacter sp.]MDX2072041.1 caspase family protein [Haliscomenobacter sp.]